VRLLLQHCSIFSGLGLPEKLLWLAVPTTTFLIAHEMHKEEMLAGALVGKATLSWRFRPDAFCADDVKATGYTVKNTLAPCSPPVLDALQHTMFKNTAATSSFNNEEAVTACFGDCISPNFVSLLESFSFLLTPMVTLAEP